MNALALLSGWMKSCVALRYFWWLTSGYYVFPVVG
jgi:hypothetical protein